MTAPTAPAEFANPPVLSGAPLSGQGIRFNPASGEWDPAAGDFLGLAPTGAIRETVPRAVASLADVAALATGTLLVSAIELTEGDEVSSLTFLSGATALATATHQWAVLLDATRTVVAVSADRTSGAWAADTPETFAMGAAYTVAASGLYYAGLMVAATTPPSLLVKADGVATAAGVAPILAASSSTGQTTPPALGTQMGALTAVANRAYAYAG